MDTSLLISATIIIVGASVELFIYLHTNGFHRRKIARFPVGNLEFWALGDRVLVQEDEFRTGYECEKCDGQGEIPCDNCGGAGECHGKKCSHCEHGGRIVCPECKGKGGILIAPDISQRRPTSGVVVSAGPKCVTLKAGDSVLYSNFAGYVVDLNRSGKPVVMRILHETEILSSMSGHLTLSNLRGKSEIAQFSS